MVCYLVWLEEGVKCGLLSSACMGLCSLTMRGQESCQNRSWHEGRRTTCLRSRDYGDCRGASGSWFITVGVRLEP